MKYADRECNRISIYFKYSNSTQKEKLYKALRSYILSRYQTVAGVFCDRAGEPDFELSRLLQCVMAGGINSVIVPSIDMLGEDKLLVKLNISMLMQNGTELIALKYDSSFNEYLLLHGIKDYFSLGSRWDNEYGELYRKPGYEIHAGGCPFGYRRCEDGTIEVESDKAEIVCKVFGMRSLGMNSTEIAKIILAEDGIELSRGMIRAMIENERYCGKAYGRSGAFPAIVPNGLWIKANSVQHIRSVAERAGKTHLLKHVYTQDGHVRLEPTEPIIMSNCKITYSAQLPNGLIEVDANLIDKVVARIVSDFIKSNSRRICDNLKAHKRTYSELMLEKMTALENCGLINEDDVIQAVSRLCMEDGFEEFERLKLQWRKNKHMYIRAKLDYLLCCIEDHEIDEYFDRMHMFDSLGALEKRYYIYMLVRKVEVSNDSIKAYFYSGKVVESKTQREIMRFQSL